MPVLLRLSSDKNHGHVEHVDVSDISDFFSNFHKPGFDIIYIHLFLYIHLFDICLWISVSPGGIFQHMTYSGHATCFGVELCTVPRFLVHYFWGQI